MTNPSLFDPRPVTLADVVATKGPCGSSDCARFCRAWIDGNAPCEAKEEV